MFDPGRQSEPRYQTCVMEGRDLGDRRAAQGEDLDAVGSAGRVRGEAGLSVGAQWQQADRPAVQAGGEQCDDVVTAGEPGGFGGICQTASSVRRRVRAGMSARSKAAA